MDLTSPDPQPAPTPERVSASSPPVDQPRAAEPPLSVPAAAAAAGAGAEAPPYAVLQTPAPVRRMSGSRRRARRRRQRRIRWGVLLLLLTGVLFVGPSQTDWIGAGAAARAAWRYDRALAFYRVAMRRDPADPRPYCLTGEVLALQQELRAASAAFTRCRALGEDTAPVALRLGDLASAQRDDRTAEREWLHSISLGGSTARRQLALWHEARGEFDQAATQWHGLGARDGQAQEHLGMLALRVEDFATAQRAFLAARELPGFYGQDAVDAEFVQLAALGANIANAATSIGVAFVRADLPTFARLPLEQAVAESPDNATAQAYLAWVDVLAGEQAAATEHLARALMLAPQDQFTQFVAASQAAERGEWSAAADDCFAALRQDDKNPAIWLLLARAQEGEHAYLDAELSYERAAALGTEPEYTQRLLTYYIDHRLGLLDGRAYDAGVRAQLRFPKNAAIRRLEGQIDDLLGQYDNAYQAWTTALRLDPSDPEPWFVLGQYDYVAGNLTSALVYLRAAVSLRPGSEWAARARHLLAPLPNATL